MDCGEESNVEGTEVKRQRLTTILMQLEEMGADDCAKLVSRRLEEDSPGPKQQVTTRKLYGQAAHYAESCAAKLENIGKRIEQAEANLQIMRDELDEQEKACETAERARLSILARLQREDGTEDESPEIANRQGQSDRGNIVGSVEALSELLQRDPNEVAQAAMKHHVAVMEASGGPQEDPLEPYYFAVRHCIRA
eukprot:3199116-Alexandrium_andersonii.AAC.1